MPARASSICRHPGCGKRIPEPGYCDKHAGEARSNWLRRADRTGSTTARGYGWAWRKTRERILQRDNGLCVPCLVQGRTTSATEVDHVIPKAHGGTDDDGNLQSTCQACHKAKTAREHARR